MDLPGALRLRLFDGRAGGDAEGSSRNIDQGPFTQEEIDIIPSDDAWVWLSGS